MLITKALRHETREQWLASRRNFIGASETAAILGHGYANQNAATVFAAKICEGREDKQVADAMLVGTLIEPGLLRVFSHFTGLQAELEEPYLVRLHPEKEFIAATLDGIATLGPELGSESVALELKNVDKYLSYQWRDGNIPAKFWIQCQHQMLVTESRRMFLLALVGGNEPVVREIQADPEFQAFVVHKLTEFWGFVSRKEMPGAEWIDWSSDATTEAIRKMHPEDNGLTVYLGAEADELIEEWEYYRDKKKKFEKLETAVKNRLKAAIGENTFGVTPNGTYLSLQTSVVAEHVRAESSRRSLRIMSEKIKGRRR